MNSSSNAIPEPQTQPKRNIPILPTGTVTFLFTDIVGSTPLWEQHPDRMAAALQIHNTALRQAIEAQGGVVFKVVGDAFQAVFATAPQALKAAMQGQMALQAAQWNELGPLSVRMGLHTGEAELDSGGDEYAVSHAKNRAARIMSAAHGGQILLSAETGALCDHQLPPGVSLKDVGEHRLKGMSALEHLFQAYAPGLSQEFPPLASAITRPNNLPVQLTSFIGRQKEIAQLCLLLKKPETRLLTLTGSGGTGKTRLALQVASALLEDFPDGVWLVELAPLTDPLIIPQAVISALGLVEQPGKTPAAYLADYLREKRLLLILDNCEHLVEACTELAAALLHAAPKLTILASSREILGVEGEISFRVPPLGMPDLRHLPPLDQLAQFDAVRLFVERARVVSPEFDITEANAADVAQITYRLDGIPLALELAAARVRMLSAGQIALRLDDAFRLLTGGSRAALPRHQTLHALIDWSYNLLSEVERGLLRGLSAFAGSWTLEAAEEVCGGERIPAKDILDLIGQLVDKSLILAAPGPGGEMRYRMLETVRQYAHARLVEAGEAAVVRSRHLAYYLLLAERLEPKFRSREQIQTLNTCDDELDNLRLALEWGLQTDVEAELRLAAALQWFWHIRFHWSEGIAWLEQGLEVEERTRGNELPAGPRAVIRAKALTALGFHIPLRGDIPMEKALEYLVEATALYRELGQEHRKGLAWALVWSSGWMHRNADLDRAPVLAGEALDLFRETGDAHGMAESLQNLGICEIDPTRQIEIHLQQFAIDQANGDVEGMATALNFKGWAEFISGEYASACDTFEAGRARYMMVGNPFMAAWMSIYMSISFLFLGDSERSDSNLKEALTEFREIAYDGGIFIALFWQSYMALQGGRFDLAAELNDEITTLALKMNGLGEFSFLHYLRARQARLVGDKKAARLYEAELLSAATKPTSARVWALTEMGTLALMDGNLKQARIHFIDGFKAINLMWDRFWIWLPLDGMAILAVREGRLERAARLFGTRQCRGFYHTLSPIERAEREADFAAIKAALGEERFEELRSEGYAMTFQQTLAMGLDASSSLPAGHPGCA